MAQFPIISGIYADGTPELRTSYPVNFVPVPKQSGVSMGYLRPADGLVEFATGPGVDRGGINWNGVCYRVMDGALVRVTDTGAITEIGNVGNDGAPVSMAYSFTYLAIASAGGLYLSNGTSVTQVTDADLGLVVDVEWVDGYFMTTDGESLVVTDLNDPFAVNPLKYGSSEADPDPVLALQRLRNEIAALNRYTIEFFDNVGGTLFPFQRIEGAQIEKGCIGTHACCVFQDTIAFLGSAFNEPASVYVGANGNAVRVATHEIDTVLEGYTEEQLSTAVVEARKDAGHEFLYVHLVDRTLVYDAVASAAIGVPVWFTLTSTDDGFAQYRARHIVWCYGQWIAGDPTSQKLCSLVRDISSHFGEKVRWEFGTVMAYSDGAGLIFHDLELVALTGAVALGDDPLISSTYSLDGVTWSAQRAISAGRTGDRSKRLVWFGQGTMRDRRVQRFQGTSDAHISPMRMNARVEPLAW